MSYNICINKTDNTVSLTEQNNRIIITDNKCYNTVEVTQPITNVVTVNTLGPQGPVGPAGDSVFTRVSESLYSATASFDITGSIDITGSLAVSLTQQTLNKIVVWDESDNKFYYANQSDLDDDDWYDGGTFITSSKNVEITGSFVVDIANQGPSFFLIKSGSKTVAQFNSQGVFTLGTFDYTPDPVEGGIFYSGSGEFFVGLE